MADYYDTAPIIQQRYMQLAAAVCNSAIIAASHSKNSCWEKDEANYRYYRDAFLEGYGLIWFKMINYEQEYYDLQHWYRTHRMYKDSINNIKNFNIKIKRSEK